MNEQTMKKISIVSGCYNEVGNIEALYARCRAVLAKFPQYDYEFIIADNMSTDGTRDLLRKIAGEDTKFKVILNANNFGHIRSPYNAFVQATGDAVVLMCSDLQEPPEVIEDFVKQWEAGYKVIVGVRAETKASWILEQLRIFYYWLLAKLAPDEKVISRFTGFGLYDACFVNALRKFHEPYPYFRGLVSEIGFPRIEVPFVQEARKSGKTKNNFFTLYDMAMTGVVNHTKLPLRISVFFGFLLGLLSFLLAVGYLLAKLLMWDTFSLGFAPLIVGMFFFSSIQLIFIGVLGEYLGAIWIQVKNRPYVVEEEKINFAPADTSHIDS